MVKFCTEIRVRYADTDQMGIVYNGKYLEYFEVGRTELLRNLGLAYNEVEQAGYQLPLVEAGLKYKLPANYDDILVIESRLDELFTPKVHINYVIKRKGEDAVLTDGFTTHYFVRREDMKVVRPPKIYIDKLKPYFEKEA